MKNLVFTIIIIFTLSACSKSNQRKFVDEVSGNYNIASITFSKRDLITDSITFTNAGEFVFENCKIQKEQESSGICPGYYIFNNEPKFNFGYNLQKDNNGDILLIQPNNSPVTKKLFLLNSYRFTERTNDKLVINSVSSVQSENNFFKVKITLVRK